MQNVCAITLAKFYDNKVRGACHVLPVVSLPNIVLLEKPHRYH